VLYFNLGNAKAQSGKPIDAILAYERALRLAPNDPDTRANLELVRAKLAGTKPGEASGAANTDEHGSVVLADVVQPLIAPFPLPFFAGPGAAANALLFASLFLRRRAANDGTRRLARLTAILSALALAFAIAVCAGHFIVARDPRAVVTEVGDIKE